MFGLVRNTPFFATPWFLSGAGVLAFLLALGFMSVTDQTRTSRTVAAQPFWPSANEMVMVVTASAPMFPTSGPVLTLPR